MDTKADYQKQLAQLWPLYGLSISTPRLEMRIPSETDLYSLAVAAQSIAARGELEFQQSWMYKKSPDMEQELLKRHWGRLANWDRNDWNLSLAVYVNNNPVGLQDMWAKDFTQLRTVATGSWLNLNFQGKGYGTEMRAAVLQLIFEGLGANEAYSDYFEGNEQSAAVSRKLGYIDNGQKLSKYNDECRVKKMVRLPRERWQPTPMKIEVNGLKPCLEFFGVDPS